MDGLFVGVATLDFIYLVDTLPKSNQKIVAIEQTVAAGGPATNAAVTFSFLRNQATLLGIIGSHSISQLIRSDLATHAVTIIDLNPDRLQSPPVSSIIVTKSTGERAVISINATKFQAQIEQLPTDILEGIDIVLIDGHQMLISQAIAQQAKQKNIPVVIDGGSWKPGFEQVLPFVDYAICSANFYPPNCHTQADVFAYLKTAGIPYIAITQGEKPIQSLISDRLEKIEIPLTQVVDTLGAGDILHGAFCHYILQKQFSDALALAAQIASCSCQFFGTRQWLKNQAGKP